MTLDAARVAELRELLAKATPRPWRRSASCTGVVGADSEWVAHVSRITPQTDVELIAAAVNALPGLLAVYDAAVALCDQPALEDDATWGDIAQSHVDGPRLMKQLIAAVNTTRAQSKEG